MQYVHTLPDACTVYAYTYISREIYVYIVRRVHNHRNLSIARWSYISDIDCTSTPSPAHLLAACSTDMLTPTLHVQGTWNLSLLQVHSQMLVDVHTCTCMERHYNALHCVFFMSYHQRGIYTESTRKNMHGTSLHCIRTYVHVHTLHCVFSHIINMVYTKQYMDTPSIIILYTEIGINWLFCSIKSNLISVQDSKAAMSFAVPQAP